MLPVPAAMAPDAGTRPLPLWVCTQMVLLEAMLFRAPRVRVPLGVIWSVFSRYRVRGFNIPVEGPIFTVVLPEVRTGEGGVPAAPIAPDDPLCVWRLMVGAERTAGCAPVPVFVIVPVPRVLRLIAPPAAVPAVI